MDWEHLIFLVVFAVLSLIQSFFKKDEDDAPKPKKRSSTPQATTEDARRIQEDIRRKIEARRKQQESTTPAKRRYEIDKPYHEQSYPAQVYQESTQSKENPQTIFEDEPEEVKVYDYQAEIDKARRKAAASREHLNSTRNKHTTGIGSPITGSIATASTSTPRSNVRAEVFAMLRDAHGARKGFLMQEILGAPIALRRPDASTPWH